MFAMPGDEILKTKGPSSVGEAATSYTLFEIVKFFLSLEKVASGATGYLLLKFLIK